MHPFHQGLRRLLCERAAGQIQLRAHQGRDSVSRRIRVVADVIDIRDQTTPVGDRRAIAFVQCQVDGGIRNLEAAFPFTVRNLEIGPAFLESIAIGRAGDAGVGVAHDQDIGTGQLVLDHRRAAARHRTQQLHRHTDYLLLVRQVPAGEGLARVGKQHRQVGGLVDKGQVVELGNVSIPETGMADVILKDLHGETAVFDLLVRLGHFLVRLTDIEVKGQHRAGDEKAERYGDHQFDQAETRTPPYRGLVVPVHHVTFPAHRSATLTTVLTTRRHRSLEHVEPDAPS
ncbi:hypothetical protein D3C84_417590 [compost metagenome]